MRLSNIPNLFKLSRINKLKQDFNNYITAFIAASGVFKRNFLLLDKSDNCMLVNRDDLAIWSEYFINAVCRVEIKKGLFYIIPKSFNIPPYYIKGANLKLTYQPKRWSKKINKFMIELQKSEYQVFSQHGEDGVVQAILSKIPVKHHYLVEFGAHDGCHMSNSRYLIKKGWNALLIEGDNRFFKQLERLYFDNKKVITKQKMLTINNINEVFHYANVPIDFDFLSIDVDGPDYDLWKALTGYEPSIVMIEYDANILIDKEYIVSQDKDSLLDYSSTGGTNLYLLCQLAYQKGYTPIYTELSGSNLFCIHNKYKKLLNIEDIAIDILYQPPQFGDLANGIAINGRGM